MRKRQISPGVMKKRICTQGSPSSSDIEKEEWTKDRALGDACGKQAGGSNYPQCPRLQRGRGGSDVGLVSYYLREKLRFV